MRLRPLAIALAILSSACHGEREGGPADLRPKLTLWTEFLSYDDVIAEMPFMAERRLDLNLGVTKGEHSFADMERVILEGDAWGVKVNLWPELSFEEGRWPNVKNVAVFSAYMRDMMNYVRDRDLPVDTIIVDMETNYDKIQSLFQLFRDGDLLGAIRILADDYDPAVYAEGEFAFGRLVDEAHGMGFRVHLTVPGLTVDDFVDGDLDLHRLFDLAIFRIDWDEVSYQLYRSLFWDIAGPLVGGGEIWSSYYVYSYAQTLKVTFGDKAAIDLGIVGTDFQGLSGYSDPADLQDDIRAAMAAGFTSGQLDLFALDGISVAADPDAWVVNPRKAGPPPEIDPRVADFRAALIVADLLVPVLDVLLP